MTGLMERPVRAEKPPVEWFPTGARLAEWSYTSKPARGRCRIDGRTLHLRLRLELKNVDAVPDVLAVEAWLAWAGRTEATVEEYAKAAVAEFGGKVTVVGSTATHGKIRATLTASDNPR